MHIQYFQVTAAFGWPLLYLKVLKRTQRILGELLKEDEEIQKGGNPTMVKQLDHREKRKTLKDYGLSKYESSTFQKIADLPEEDFEQEIAIAKEDSRRRVELTTSRVLKAAKKHEKELLYNTNSLSFG